MTIPIEITSLMHQLPIYLLQAHEGAESLSLLDRIKESNVVNVVLVAALLGYFIKKNNLFAGVDTQREKIAVDVETVEKQKREALAQLDDVKRRTSNLKAEVEEILKGARDSAEALSVQILTDAKSESAKIIENAKKRVELEQRSAAKELERRLLNDALADARAELAGTLTPSDQRRSVETFLDEISQLKGGGR